MRNTRQNQRLTLNNTTKNNHKNEINNPTNNQIFDNVFAASAGLLHQDTELSVELLDETAFPHMSDFDE